jgi:hypothetical protein
VDPANAVNPDQQAASAPVVGRDVPVADLANVEVPVAPERDSRGVSYVFNLVALYAIFAVSLLIIAWFGIFSEV